MMCSQTCTSSLQQRAQRGASLVAVLAYVTVVSLALAGAGLLTVSHLARASSEADYTSALNVAEAGINYEIGKITANPLAADQSTAHYTGTMTVRTGATGTYEVYITNQLGGTWYPPANMLIHSTGTLNVNTVSGNRDQIQRTVVVNASPFGAFYTVFGSAGVNVNPGSAAIDGVLGTNGTLTFNGRPSMTRTIMFAGPNAKWAGGKNPDDTVYKTQTTGTVTVDNVNKYASKTSDDHTRTLEYFRAHNDNNLAQFIGNAYISDGTFGGNGEGEIILKGKAGGANYFIDSLALLGNSRINFDNTDGPIYVWVSDKANAYGGVFRGGAAKVSMQQDPRNAVRMFSAIQGSLIVQAPTKTGTTSTTNGSVAWDDPSSPIAMGIVAYNVNEFNNTVGSITLNGDMQFQGQVYANRVLINGSPKITGQAGYFGDPNYYGFSGGWRELNKNGQIGGPTQ